MTHFWQLRIRELNHEDAGKYECQVSTTPPMGHQMYLKVVGENIVLLNKIDVFIENFEKNQTKKVGFWSNTRVVG